ncbi:MAG: hypothetical protein INR71_01620 [Terriglobus roseus]|nr:hypothetical protein [Terriglobus roseus]
MSAAEKPRNDSLDVADSDTAVGTQHSPVNSNTPPNTARASLDIEHRDSASLLVSDAQLLNDHSTTRDLKIYAEDVADRNIKEERARVVHVAESASADASAHEQRTRRVYANPHSSSEFYLSIVAEIRYH